MILVSDFEKKVYLAVSAIPYGETRSYAWVAEQIGRPGAARAVGQALKRNPLPMIIPCHRVVKSCGDLGGYKYGRRWKEKLLEMERK
ncbi:MAG: MGMT family protein [Actinomycetota bacterium]